MKNIILILAVISIVILSCKKEKKTLASIITTAASNVTASTIITGGNITADGNSGITQRGIAWADHAAPTVGDSITKDGSGIGSFNSTISNLNSNTTYYIRAYATNASGTAYGNEVSVKTAAGVPSIITTAISNIQPLSVVSGGNIINDGGATVTERGVVYATTANPTLNNFKITAGTGTGNFTATLQPLASQTTYYVRAYATNSFGTAYGNQVQFNAASANTVTDIDGNVYPYVTLCDGKSWMATNLKTTKFKNGDLITNGLSGFTWANTTTPAYTFPNGDVTKKDSLGLLYNEYVVANSKGICPAGWHVPTDAEWQAVEVCNGMDPSVASINGNRGTIGSKFLVGGSTGMNIKGAGYYLYYVGSSSIGYNAYGISGSGYLWTSSTSAALPNSLRSRIFNPGNDPAPINRYFTVNEAQSIRCVKD
jgi:uncharacterized protein (TIGR02145 family)